MTFCVGEFYEKFLCHLQFNLDHCMWK